MQINFRRSEVIDASCTCAAGKGLCHHTVAVLYQLQHYQKLGLKVVPPLASKTSMPQVKKYLNVIANNYDPEADPSFGLLEIKCPVLESINDCKFLTRSPEGLLHLKKSHEYYYQIIGQLGLAGNQWWDLFVKADADYHCERIYFDEDFFYAMKEKLDIFYFNHFLPLYEI